MNLTPMYCGKRVIWKKTYERPQDQEDCRCLNRLKKDESITCTMIDKTEKTVIMDKTDYIVKIESTINEMHVKKVFKSPLLNLTSTVKELIREKKFARKYDT